MVTTSYATPQDIKDKIGYTDDSTTDAELQTVIEEAHRTLEMRVGTKFFVSMMITEVERETNEVPETYSLKLRPLLDTGKVIVNGEIIDDSNYSFDRQEGTITFDTDFRDEELDLGDTIEVETVPKQFKDLEVWYAISYLYSSNVIQVDDEQVKVQQEEAEMRARKLEAYINSKVPVGTVTDGRVNRGYE